MLFVAIQQSPGHRRRLVRHRRAGTTGGGAVSCRQAGGASNRDRPFPACGGRAKRSPGSSHRHINSQQGHRHPAVHAVRPCTTDRTHLARCNTPSSAGRSPAATDEFNITIGVDFHNYLVLHRPGLAGGGRGATGNGSWFALDCEGCITVQNGASSLPPAVGSPVETDARSAGERSAPQGSGETCRQ